MLNDLQNGIKNIENEMRQKLRNNGDDYSMKYKFFIFQLIGNNLCYMKHTKKYNDFSENWF